MFSVLENKAQRGLITCPESHSSQKEQSWESETRQSGSYGLCSPRGKKCCVTFLPTLDLELVLVLSFLTQPCPQLLYKALRQFSPWSQVGSPAWSLTSIVL